MVKYFYPFSAIVAQNNVKESLIYNLINPLIGGVLLSGQKGTAKSTMVRSLSDLIPSTSVINLPLNITEDMLIGTIDIKTAMQEGRRSFQYGMLEKVNGNILYVDEVNLLSNTIVNSLLDVSQSGVNRVEREGISFCHKSQFILVGTMNPEEGKIRPEFLDRFGLYVEVKGSIDKYERKEIIKRRLEFETDPERFIEKYRVQSQTLAKKIVKAKDNLSNVMVSGDVLDLAINFAKQANCVGHRGDLVIVHTAKAIAAYEGRDYIALEDVKKAAMLALPHRTRQLSEDQVQSSSEYDSENNEQDVEEQGDEKQDIKENNQEEINENQQDLNRNPNESSSDDQDNNHDSEQPDDIEDDISDGETLSNEMPSMDDEIIEGEEVYHIKDIDVTPMDKLERRGSGRRSKTRSGTKKGRYVGYRIPKNDYSDIAFDATIRAAAPYQTIRENNGMAFTINKNDIRVKTRENRVGTTILFVVDASGSMGADKRMKETKEAVLSLLFDAYQKRDNVGLIAFRKEGAEVLLNFTRSVDLAQKQLQKMATGGRTPLFAGLSMAWQIIKTQKLKEPDMLPLIVLVTDGRANYSEYGEDPVEEAIKASANIAHNNIPSIVIDTENNFLSLEIAKQIALAMNANYFKIQDLKAEEIQKLVRDFNPLDNVI
ncbi:MAG: magnesium chelatase subunit D family protein [Eubacteriaceae bacterium]